MITAFWWTVSRAGERLHNDVLQGHMPFVRAGQWLQDRARGAVAAVTIFAFQKATGGTGKVTHRPVTRTLAATKDEGTW
jgi:hypothetical protein